MKLKKTIRIGRHPNNDIVYDNNSISRNHAILYCYDDGSYEIEDTSTNGTFVNGAKLSASKVRVSPDDLINFADVQRFDWDLIVKEKAGNRSRNILVPILLISAVLLSYYFFFMRKIDPCEGYKCDIKCIQQKYDKSVGLLCMAYFLKVDFSNRKLFIGFNKQIYEKDQKLVKDVNIDLNKLLPFLVTGTGFLIRNTAVGDHANLVTNRHVADPSWLVNHKDYNDESEREFYEDIIKKTDEAERFWNLTRNPNRKFLTHTSIAKFIPSGSILPIVKNMTYQELLNKLGTGNAIVSRWSNDANIDIALLTTDIPLGDYYQIDLEKETQYELKCVEVGDATTILGYSGGISSGYNFDNNVIEYQTSIKNISKPPSPFLITYDIPTEGGSSGSPIFDENGKLIAVHYSKQGIKGLGVPVKFLKDVLEFKNVIQAGNTSTLEHGN